MDYIKINKQTKKPIYLQIADSITEAYNDRALSAGDALPTEKEICESFHISSIVVKNAYQTLIDRGIVKRESGRGTFVKKPPKFSLELSEAFELFLNDPYFTRKITYQDTYTNTDYDYLPKGPCIVIYEFLMHQQKPVGLRKLFVLEDYIKLFVNPEKSPNQIVVNRAHFDSLTSYFQMQNLTSKDAHLLQLKPGLPTFYQAVRFGIENTFIASIQNYYPGQHFVMEETHAARVH